MALNKEQLLAKGAVTPKLVEVTFPDGSVDTVYIKPLSGLAYVDEMKFTKTILPSGDAKDLDMDKIRELSAYRIINQVVDESGSQYFTRAEVLTQTNAWINTLERAIKSIEKLAIEAEAKN